MWIGAAFASIYFLYVALASAAPWSNLLLSIGAGLIAQSEENQKIVEICGEKGISVIPANFDQMKRLVKEHDAEDSGSHD